jgi:4-diphosphocytidyl-2-C-methyl-D-erythritol kinase
VPFFLVESGCALAEGRGERLTPLPSLPERWVVLVKPPVGISSGAVYQAFPPSRWSDGARTRAWLERAAGGDIPPPFNAMEPVALEVAPDAAAAREALRLAGAPFAVMSGSGSTYFTLMADAHEAAAVHARLRQAGHDSYLATLASPDGPRAGRPAR